MVHAGRIRGVKVVQLSRRRWRGRQTRLPSRQLAPAWSVQPGNGRADDVGGREALPDVPLDHGHFLGPYFEHFLLGLRSSPPAYVRDLLADAEVPDELQAAVAGVVLITT